MDILRDIVKKNINFLDTIENFHKDLDAECDSFLKEIDNFLTSGNIEFVKNAMNGKENVDPVEPTSKRKGRQKKPGLTDITEVNVSCNTVDIKKEKISDIQNVPEDAEPASIKKELEEMPAPRKLPPRKKKIKSEKVEEPKRSTRSRTRTKIQENEEPVSDKEAKSRNKSSDVVIETPTITTIEISDSEKEAEMESEAEKNADVRNTRSKMRKRTKASKDADKIEDQRSTRTKRKKRARSASVEIPVVQTESKKSRSNSNGGQECNGSARTEYEDAVSSIETNQASNATYIASSKDSQGTNEKVASINSTVIVENPKIVLKETGAKDIEDPEAISPEPVKKTKGGTKQIFSPYENTPLKKKVEAFEKLGSSSGIPTRVTRTNKVVQKNNIESKEEYVEKLIEKQKYKALTPIMDKFQPKVCSTSKINKLHPHYGLDVSTNNESILSMKSASALKASQAEFRERERRRQEKEREALKKREALLQAQTEEKRRKREEKQQKAQQQREILEKEKQRQLEAQRVKEEKYRQVMAEREEKLQKQREEAERKRLLAKKKAEMQREKEREEEARKQAEMKAVSDRQEMERKLALKKAERLQQQEQQALPIYMTTKAPLLPTNDCYDSDDPEFENVRRHEPHWSRDPEVSRQQVTMIIAGESIKNSFFCRQAHTPDLTEIFEHIDRRKLKRTSSAIWRKPPRYTLMPITEDQLVFSEESD